MPAKSIQEGGSVPGPRGPNRSLGLFEKQRELAAFRFRTCEIGRQPLVEMRVADEQHLPRAVRADELGNFLHFGYTAQ